MGGDALMAGHKPRHKWADTTSSDAYAEANDVECAHYIAQRCPLCGTERGWPVTRVRPKGPNAVWWFRGNGRRRWGKVMPPCLLPGAYP